MKQSCNMAEYLNQVQETYRSRPGKNNNHHGLTKLLKVVRKEALNPSCFETTKHNFNSSISQKINNYTKELKGYLLQQFDNSINLNESQCNSLLAKLRTQSSKNVKNSKNSKNSKFGRTKVARSAKEIKLQSQSSTQQPPYFINQTVNNIQNQKQSAQDNFMVTSLSKIVDKTYKKIDFQINCLNCSKCSELQSRLSKLEALVQTLVEEKTTKCISVKVESSTQIKQEKTIFRRRHLASSQKKKFLSQHRLEKDEKVSQKKIPKKGEITKISSKLIDQTRVKRNIKQNAKPLNALKKPMLKLNTNYQPIMEYGLKSSKKVLFINSKIQNATQKPQKEQIEPI